MEREQPKMKVKIKKLHPNAVIPQYAKDGDAGMDITAIDQYLDDHDNIVYQTGLAFEIPVGYVGLLFPRSSNAKKDLILTNSVGVLDSGYRGEVLFKYKQTVYPPEHYYKDGERIGQIIILPYPQIEFVEAEELTASERGTGGFGSTN